MKIACAQMRVVPGRPDINFSTMCRFITQAKEQGCSIVAFPEMCVGGYLLGDKWTEERWCSYLMSYNEKLRQLSENILIMYGNVYVDYNRSNKDGRVRKFNAGYAWYNGSPLKGSPHLPDGMSVKSLLPNYRIFDDERYFFSLQELSNDLGVRIEELLVPLNVTINDQKIRIGLEICEDLWFNDYYYHQKPLNISGILIENGADLIFNLSSSPWTYGKNKARNNRIRDAYKQAGTFRPFFYVNCTGVQNNGKNFVTFDGDSTIYNETGNIICEASEPYLETMLVYDSSQQYATIEKKQTGPIESKFAAAVEGIRSLDELMGRSDYPVIIGLSGGVDSALVACLTERALGKERIIACTLPTKYNSEKTQKIAEHVANSLGIAFHSIPIESLVDENEKIVSRFSPSEFNMENIQAKIRGTTVLSNIAGITGGVMTNNGNKIEVALGYATLYGDVNGVIAPIGDMLKTEVFEMSSYFNNEIYRSEVVPSILLPDELFDFHLPPSAELKHNQVDPMKWGYHDALVRLFTDYRKLSAEQILEWYIEGTLCTNLEISERLYKKYNLDNPTLFINDLEWVVSNMQRAVFKRVQAPPIIILSKGSYGYDIRESQLQVHYTEQYLKLKNRILKIS
jgi:NAD+ synthase (glutamine-hydrolysing)